MKPAVRALIVVLLAASAASAAPAKSAPKKIYSESERFTLVVACAAFKAGGDVYGLLDDLNRRGWSAFSLSQMKLIAESTQGGAAESAQRTGINREREKLKNAMRMMGYQLMRFWKVGNHIASGLGSSSAVCIPVVRMYEEGLHCRDIMALVQDQGFTDSAAGIFLKNDVIAAAQAMEVIRGIKAGKKVSLEEIGCVPPPAGS